MQYISSLSCLPCTCQALNCLWQVSRDAESGSLEAFGFPWGSVQSGDAIPSSSPRRNLWRKEVPPLFLGHVFGNRAAVNTSSSGGLLFASNCWQQLRFSRDGGVRTVWNPRLKLFDVRFPALEELSCCQWYQQKNDFIVVSLSFCNVAF